MALLCFFLTLFASLFKSKSRLEAENAALRHQLIVLRRRVSGRVQLTNGDRLFLAAAAPRASMRRLMLMRSPSNDGRSASECPGE
jgi:hypothetical protein